MQRPSVGETPWPRGTAEHERVDTLRPSRAEPSVGVEPPRSLNMKLPSIVAVARPHRQHGDASPSPSSPNIPAPSVIGAPRRASAACRSIADTLFAVERHVNVDTDQSSAGVLVLDHAGGGVEHPDPGRGVHRATPARSASASGSAPTPSNIVSYNLLLGGAVANDAVGMTIVGNTLNVFGPAADCGVQVQLRHLHRRADQPELVRLLLPALAEQPDLLLARPAERRPARTDRVHRASRTAARPTGCSPTRTAPTSTTTTWRSRSSRSRPCRSRRPTR